jgi:hypothetical protein
MKIFFIFTLTLIYSLNAQAKEKELTDNHICRAAISTIFDQTVEEVEIFRVQGEVNYIKFPKDEDNKVTRFKCIVRGSDIIWATEMGAYRNTGIDSKITYERKKNVLTVKEEHKNGSVFRKAFDVKKLIAE